MFAVLLAFAWFCLLLFGPGWSLACFRLLSLAFACFLEPVFSFSCLFLPCFRFVLLLFCLAGSLCLAGLLALLAPLLSSLLTGMLACWLGCLPTCSRLAGLPPIGTVVSRALLAHSFAWLACCSFFYTYVDYYSVAVGLKNCCERKKSWESRTEQQQCCTRTSRMEQSKWILEATSLSIRARPERYVHATISSPYEPSKKVVKSGGCRDQNTCSRR